MISKGSWTAVRIMILILTIAAIAGGTAYAASAVSKNNLLETEAAEDFARLDAGVKQEDINVTQTELRKKNGKYVYNITFNIENTLYKYEISADDGTILAKEIENEDQKVASEVDPDHMPDRAAGTDQNTAANQSPVTDQTPVTATEDAPETAQPGVTATDDTPKTAQPGVTATDDTSKTSQPGVTVSDGAPDANKHSSTDADVTTAAENAQTSETNTRGQKTKSPNYINVDQARRIALEHAGFTENEVRFTKAMFENDDEDGVEFEIEFYVGNVEYDYDINAMTGEILDFSSEVDD